MLLSQGEALTKCSVPPSFANPSAGPRCGFSDIVFAQGLSGFLTQPGHSRSLRPLNAKLV